MTSGGSAHPQAARLVLRVGVTGHRAEGLEKLGANPVHLRETVRHVLERVREIALNFAREAQAVYSTGAPILRLLSPMAEGADRLVAKEALALGYELQCLLPFPREVYEEDFDRPGSTEDFRRLLSDATKVLELDGDPKKRSEAYLAAGKTLLLQCDLLIAVWDGAPAQGEGGTGQVVEEAIRLEVPTVWIGPGRCQPAYLLKPGARPSEAEGDTGLESLEQRLRATFLLPSSAEPAGRAVVSRIDRLWRYFLPSPTSDRERFLRFLREEPPSWKYGFLFQLFRHLWTGRWTKLRKLRKNLLEVESHPRRKAGWESLDGWEAIEEGYLTHFDWANSLAEAYAGRYRSSFLLAYLMGACAVLVAFLGYEEQSRPWFIIEFILILLILLITLSGRREGWHERWMDYRLLAEALRPMEFLALIGRVPPVFKVPVHLRPSDPRQSWCNWHFRALARQAGLAKASVDREYLQDYQKVLQRSIKRQVNYHHDNHESFERLHHRPHFMAQLFFVLAAIACFLHVTGKWERGFDTILSFCAIVLPSLGAAFAAILHHGEFERLALRSRALGARLEQLRREVASVAPESGRLSRIAEEFADLMMSELVDWRFVFLDKDLDLPA